MTTTATTATSATPTLAELRAARRSGGGTTDLERVLVLVLPAVERDRNRLMDAVNILMRLNERELTFALAAAKISDRQERLAMIDERTNQGIHRLAERINQNGD